MTAEGWKWAAILTMLIATIWYAHLLYKDQVSPAPAAWIIATIAMGLSWATYWETANPSFVGNIGVIASTVSIVALTGFYLTLLWIRKKLRVSFTKSQYISLFLTALIVIYWKQSQHLTEVDRATVSFLALQAILVLSYIVMVEKIISIKRNPDSIVMWIIVGIASVFAWQAAELSNDTHGIINSLRAIFSSVVLVPLMIAYDLRNGRWSRSGESS